MLAKMLRTRWKVSSLRTPDCRTTVITTKEKPRDANHEAFLCSGVRMNLFTSHALFDLLEILYRLTTDLKDSLHIDRVHTALPRAEGNWQEKNIFFRIDHQNC